MPVRCYGPKLFITARLTVMASTSSDMYVVQRMFKQRNAFPSFKQCARFLVSIFNLHFFPLNCYRLFPVPLSFICNFLDLNDFKYDHIPIISPSELEFSVHNYNNTRLYEKILWQQCIYCTEDFS
jgi:hypothetical protein